MNFIKITITYLVVLASFFTLSTSCAYSGNLMVSELAEIYSNENHEERAKQLRQLYTTASEQETFLILPHLAKASIQIGHYEDAKEYSEKLLYLSNSYKDNWSYGNAIHDANMVLGLVALHIKDIELSKEYLAKAGDTPGSYQIKNVGPNMMLAKALVEIGEFDAVTLYLNKIKNVWTQRNDALKSWITQVNNNQVPDFEGNLDL